MKATERKRHSRSLEQRIRQQLFWVLLLVMAALLALVHVGVGRLTQDFVLSRLQHDADSLIAALELTPDGWTLAADRLPDVYQRVHSGHYYQLQSDGVMLRSRSLWDQQPNTVRLSVGDSLRGLEPGISGQRWLMWQQGFSKQGQNFSLWIAEDIAPLQREQLGFERYLLLLVALTVPALLLLQRRILRRGFARLQPLQQALETRQAGGVAELPTDVPSEVKPLVSAIEQLLQRSDEQIRRSRTALGNLAHELKRPLQQLQWLADQVPETEAEQVRQLYQQLHHRVERELRRARIAGSPSPGRQFRPCEEIPHLVTLLSRIGSDEIDFDGDWPDVAMPFDRDDMLELLGNLLDNAWRHAHQRVRLQIDAPTLTQPHWHIRVEDDGNGVPEQQLAQLAQRGLRLDEQAGEGSGLGLSICTAIVESYTGELSFEGAEIGGLRVEVELPAHRSAE
ncbi:MAG: sensor histidine kinase [Oceanospirillales bacterium]|uniref:histidine kinase n=1 Tax=Marinobacterium halophilum TaxID=267374 RepID=A0A2P8ETS3_9GAMM|nr:sensor histidine kinase [Marinobacterium halophilum]MBR9829515.1 sensor histidine kinase [Oceanospirillales bacterium]PSL12854.1 signal transduction histidine kinase [Marinobacterium halophilum]